MFRARHQSMSRPFHEVSLSDGSFVLATVPAARIFGSFTQKKMFAFTEFAPSETAQVSLWFWLEIADSSFRIDRDRRRVFLLCLLGRPSGTKCAREFL